MNRSRSRSLGIKIYALIVSQVEKPLRSLSPLLREEAKKNQHHGIESEESNKRCHQKVDTNIVSVGRQTLENKSIMPQEMLYSARNVTLL